MKYKILLFDVDDTLLDFQANEAESFRNVLKFYGETYTEEIFSIYKEINHKLWRDYEQGTIDRQLVLNERFARTMAQAGKTIDGAAWEQKYREELNKGTQLIEDAIAVCENLAKDHRMFVISNGVEETQQKRLKGSGLLPYFENVFISQSVGAQKPSPDFFQYMEAHIENYEKESSLVIGDSLTSDILGGNQAGIDTCWYNPKHLENASGIQSTYEIHTLRELLDNF